MASLWYSNTQVRQELGVTRKGQITDRYTKAVENLGNDTMDVRLGGIYALQRIMQDSPRDHPTIADVLATYIRIHASEPPKKGETAPADVQAALTVLAYRDTSRDGYFRLDLRGTHLAGITLVPRQSTSRVRLQTDLAQSRNDARLTAASYEVAVFSYLV
ncbi:pentapeptide repeat-containing protein, partial [Streptomyces achromogenes]